MYNEIPSSDTLLTNLNPSISLKRKYVIRDEQTDKPAEDTK